MGMWRSIGPTLKVLHSPSTPSIEAAVQAANLRNIQRFCRKLENVCIDIISRACQEYANLLASCADQLKFTDVSGLSDVHIEGVLAACPNAHWDVSMTSSRKACGTKGDRIRKLMIT